MCIRDRCDATRTTPQQCEAAGYTLEGLCGLIFDPPGADLLPDVGPQGGRPPDSPNVYGDGSASQPARPEFSFAGLGVW
eukprot:13914373-Alexandrium_andersonii.AAC.1